MRGRAPTREKFIESFRDMPNRRHLRKMAEELDGMPAGDGGDEEDMDEPGGGKKEEDTRGARAAGGGASFASYAEECRRSGVRPCYCGKPMHGACTCPPGKEREFAESFSEAHPGRKGKYLCFCNGRICQCVPA